MSNENTTENETTATAEAPKAPAKRGRKPDTTPNKEFAAKKISDNDDGTVTYEIPYNDENGVRCTRTENRKPGKRGGKGRQPDRNPSKVISGIKTERIADPESEKGGNSVVLTVPFNDKEGERGESYVVLSVNTKGNLSAKVETDKPEVYVRQRQSSASVAD